MLNKVTLCLALITSAALTSRCFGGVIFAFDYSLPASSDFFATITANGTLITDDYDAGIGGYLVVDIQGTRTVNGVNTQITGLLAPGMFYNSNILYSPGPPLLDPSGMSGLSFTVDNPLYSDDLFGNVVIYYDPYGGQYTEGAYWADYGTFTASQTPEPSTAILVLGVLAVAAGWGGRRRLRH